LNGTILFNDGPIAGPVQEIGIRLPASHGIEGRSRPDLDPNQHVALFEYTG